MPRRAKHDGKGTGSPTAISRVMIPQASSCLRAHLHMCVSLNVCINVCWCVFVYLDVCINVCVRAYNTNRNVMHKTLITFCDTFEI